MKKIIILLIMTIGLSACGGDPHEKQLRREVQTIKKAIGK